jgi:rhombotail lipoprotein
MKKRAQAICLIALFLSAASCVAHAQRNRVSALEYLYPKGKSHATPASTVTLQVPIRVGLAFAPGAPWAANTFTEQQRHELLTRVARSFEKRRVIERIELIPGSYLRLEGGFDELERLESAFGIDLIVLLSYDQHQFSESSNAS